MSSNATNVLQEPSEKKKIDSKEFNLHANSIMLKLFDYQETGFMCDVTLVAGIDNTTIKAHKSVLIAASDYFCKMLTGSFKEANQEEIILNEISGEHLKILVHYCYNGFENVTKQNFLETIRLADKFGISSLLIWCVERLKTFINNDNCIELLKLVELPHLTKYSAIIIEYIGQNLQTLQDTEKFCNLDIDEMKKILSSDDLCVSEQEAFIALKTWLDKDFDNRKIHISGLLSCIRMEQLHPKFIRSDIQPLFTLTNDLTINSMIVNALYSYCVKESNNSDTDR